MRASLPVVFRRVLTHLSRAATRPAPAKTARKPLDSHFKTDSSGRIRIEEEGSSDDDRAPSTSAGANAGPSGMGDYLEAMRGEDGHTRDARGRIKFNKTQGKRARGDDFDDDDPERDVPVTEGLKELDVTGKKRWKKQKKEVQQVGGEFKAKVRYCGALPRLFPSSMFLTSAARRRRRQEERHAAIRFRPAPASRRQEVEPEGRAQGRHHRSQALGGQEVRWVECGPCTRRCSSGLYLVFRSLHSQLHHSLCRLVA